MQSAAAAPPPPPVMPRVRARKERPAITATVAPEVRSALIDRARRERRPISWVLEDVLRAALGLPSAA